MSVLTISSFQPQVSWPFPGAVAILRYQYSSDFVDSDGQVVLRGLFKDVPCTVVAGVLSVPSHTVITTNDAVVNPLSTLSARLIDQRGTPRVWLFQQFSIPESLTPTTTIGQLEIYNQGSSLVLPPDSYLNRDEVIALIGQRLPNSTDASDVDEGITYLSVAPVSAILPIALGQNDPAVVKLADAQVLTNKTLIVPIIASFINAQHDHSDPANGGALSLGLETPTGLVDGINDAFVFTVVPVAVFLNGILQDPGGGNDYTIVGTTVTFNIPPAEGDKVRGLVQ